MPASFLNSTRSLAMNLTRRQFGQETLGSLLTYSLLQTLYGRDAFGNEMKTLAAKWLKDNGYAK